MRLDIEKYLGFLKTNLEQTLENVLHSTAKEVILFKYIIKKSFELIVSNLENIFSRLTNEERLRAIYRATETFVFLRNLMFALESYAKTEKDATLPDITFVLSIVIFHLRYIRTNCVVIDQLNEILADLEAKFTEELAKTYIEFIKFISGGTFDDLGIT